MEDMDLIQDIKEESLDIDEDVYSSEVEYPQNLLQGEELTDNIPTQKTLVAVPVKLVEVSTGKEIPFQVSIKQENTIDIHSNYQEGIADPQVMGDSIQLKEELELYPAENQEPGEVVPPREELSAEDLLSGAMKEEEKSAEETEENLQVFAESIVADNLEEDKEAKGVEFSTGCHDKVLLKKKLTHFVDECNSQTNNRMRYVNCGRLEEEQNFVMYQYLNENRAQQEKENCAFKSTSERDSEFEVKEIGSKEKEIDGCNIGENKVALHLESYGSKERDRESEEKLSELRRIRTPVEETCSIREREDMFKCHHCGDWRETKEDMTQHIQMVHGFGEDKEDHKNELTISDCSEKTSKGELGEHSKICSAGKIHICSSCDKRFKSNSHLKRHIRVHSREKPHKCSICSCAFSGNEHLKTHMLIHTGEKPYKCSICSYRCARHGSLKQHMRKHSQERRYKCSLCNSTFLQTSHLKAHIRVHTNEKPYKCSICNIGFSQHSHLKEHIRVHTGEKPYKCSICDYKFAQSGNLKMHMKIHSGDKPKKCMICDYRCSSNASMTYHMRMHNGEKPYKCSICDYKCSRNGYLKKHMRIHSGEKPYICSICHKKFSQTESLKTHMRVHSGEKPYKCPICDYKCSQNGNLKTHMTVHIQKKP